MAKKAKQISMTTEDVLQIRVTKPDGDGSDFVASVADDGILRVVQAPGPDAPVQTPNPNSKT